MMIRLTGLVDCAMRASSSIQIFFRSAGSVKFDLFAVDDFHAEIATGADRILTDGACEFTGTRGRTRAPERTAS